AENELLPRLDLILSSYLYGLDGKNIPQAYSNQYDTGRPSFAAGFKFEMPLGNRAALAREDQRQWEMSRAMHEYRAVVDTGMTEVDLALREVETAYLEMMARAEAMEFARQETDYLKERWVWLGGADRTAAALLEELLLSQERLVDEEEAFITAQVRYVIALSEVRRALGTLMMCTPANPNAPAAVAPFTAAPAAVDPSADPFGGQSPSAVPPELPSAPMPGFEAEMQPSPAPAGVQVN
ncbi:MAG: hypothetical protein KDA75_13270, partial [Planctomycetaceae bacterium]|nr:hypothetical protein [Planctomycetaceae bacterium]